MEDADELTKMDFMYGEGTGDGVIEIYKEFKKHNGEELGGVYSAPDDFVTTAEDKDPG